MRKIFTFFSLLFLFFSWQPVNAQLFNDVFDFKEVRPDFTIDGKQTKMREHNVQIVGLRGGLQWQKKYRAGLGYHFLSSKLDEMVLFQGKEVPARLNFNIISVYGEYTFYRNNKWTLNAGLQPGMGWKNNEYFLPAGGSETLEKEVFVSMEPYVSGNYKILYWVGLGGGLGYRQVMLGYPLSSYRLSGPNINFNIVIFFDALFKKFILGEDPE